VGAVGQILVIDRLRARHDTRVVVGVAYAAAGVLLAGLALDAELFVAGALLVAFGLTVSIGRTMLLTSVHVTSPDSHRAHVLSLYIFVTSVATPIGALLWGVMADWINIDAALGAAGVLLMLGIGAGLISILRHEGAAPAAADSEMAKAPGG
jgi:predicted MFS family arabinose efflux permease